MLRLPYNILLIVCITASTLAGQSSFAPEKLRFERYTSQQGLYSDLILSITQDHQGFIWVAGIGGLYRYDGNRFYKFEKNLEDVGGFHAENVKALLEDSQKIFGWDPAEVA